MVNIIVTFENTGFVPVRAKFRGEVRFENRLLEVLETEEINVPAGETVNIAVNFTPEAAGVYEIEGLVLYEKQTGTKRMVLSALPRNEGLGLASDNMLVPLAVDSLLALILVGFAIFLRRRK